jgi:hypothetical protein
MWRPLTTHDRTTTRPDADNACSIGSTSVLRSALLQPLSAAESARSGSTPTRPARSPTPTPVRRSASSSKMASSSASPSRSRARELNAARRIGRHRGFGKRKGTADARMPRYAFPVHPARYEGNEDPYLATCIWGCLLIRCLQSSPLDAPSPCPPPFTRQVPRRWQDRQAPLPRAVPPLQG